MNIAAIVMASGLSKRMGENKLLLDVDHKPMIQHVFDTINACDFYQSVVVTCYDEILKIASLNHMNSIYNANAHMGQSQSIVLGTQWIKENCQNVHGIMYFSGDIPYIKPSVVNKLMSCFEEHPHSIIRPKYHNDGLEFLGNPVIFPKSFFDELCKLEGDQGGKTIINNHVNEVFLVDIYDGKQGLDVDTKDEYEKLISK